MKKTSVQRWLRTANGQLKFLGAIIISISSLIVHYTACHRTSQSETTPGIKVYFTPQDPCIELIVSKILSAKKLILVQAYVITSERIVNALIKAHQKKLNVQLLVDKNAQYSKGSKINFMLAYGIPIIVDKTFGLAHNKIMIIDDLYVITGSFNWSAGAQTKNSENIVIIAEEDINRTYKNNWYKRAAAGE